MLIRVVVRLFPQKSGNAVIYGIRAGSAAELIRIVPVRKVPLQRATNRLLSDISRAGQW
jgi:hypothetical protein